jgi:hypothetical protein
VAVEWEEGPLVPTLVLRSVMAL